MNEKPEKEIVILNESVAASLIKDAGTFALFAGIMWFNHTYLAGNGWLDAIFVIIVVMWLAGRSTSKVYSGPIDGAIKWLQDKQQKQ